MELILRQSKILAQGLLRINAKAAYSFPGPFGRDLNATNVLTRDQSGNLT